MNRADRTKRNDVTTLSPYDSQQKCGAHPFSVDRVEDSIQLTYRRPRVGDQFITRLRLHTTANLRGI